MCVVVTGRGGWGGAGAQYVGRGAGEAAADHARAAVAELHRVRVQMGAVQRAPPLPRQRPARHRRHPALRAAERPPQPAARGTVKVWDPRQKDTPVANMEPVQGESKRDCWTVAFGNAYNQEERVVCAGYDNGDIKLFDLKTMSLRWETNIKNGVCSVEFDRKDINMNKLVATSLEGKFHVFDMRTQHPTKGFASISEKAHKSTMWQVRHLPQNRDIFITSGGAGSLHLWKYEYPAQRSKKDSEGVEMGVAGSVSLLQNVTLSTQPISSLDWSPDKRGLCVCSAFDQTVRVLIVTKLSKI
ncbi:dynein axonemal assembly factor 10 isoform X2 [Emys orbicularis]|uniref:dynein axonemal assembly factor 10 isoform X2 n=1 Tax=Emys orbicularis TaxID=82168 RepID=UPI0031FD69A8